MADTKIAILSNRLMNEARLEDSRPRSGGDTNQSFRRYIVNVVPFIAFLLLLAGFHSVSLASPSATHLGMIAHWRFSQTAQNMGRAAPACCSAKITSRRYSALIRQILTLDLEEAAVIRQLT